MNTSFLNVMVFLALSMESFAAPQVNPRLQAFEDGQPPTSSTSFEQSRQAGNDRFTILRSSTPHNPDRIFSSKSSAWHFARDSSDPSEASDLQFFHLFLTMHSVLYDFYDASFSTLSASDFKKAGYPDWVWSRFQEIQDDSMIHKEFWKSAITSLASQTEAGFEQPIFEFNRHDVRSSVDYSLALENTVTSCYVGALQQINDRGYLTVAASILSETSKHSAWINAAVKEGSPWNGPFETAITSSQCLSTISNAVSNAPSIFTNSFMSLLPLNTRIHPQLKLSHSFVAGQQSQIFFNDTAVRSDPIAHLYGVFLYGPDTLFARITKNETSNSSATAIRGYFVEIPSSLQGAAFFYVSRGDDDDVTKLKMDPDQDVVAGPTLVMFDH